MRRQNGEPFQVVVIDKAAECVRNLTLTEQKYHAYSVDTEGSGLE